MMSFRAVFLVLLPLWAMGFGSEGAPKPAEFEIRFDLPLPVTAIKAGADRICVYDDASWRLNCFDPHGASLLNVALRDKIPGMVTRLSRPFDFAILPDGGVALIGAGTEILDTPQASEAQPYWYIVKLDSSGRLVETLRSDLSVAVYGVAADGAGDLQVLGLPEDVGRLTSPSKDSLLEPHFIFSLPGPNEMKSQPRSKPLQGISGDRKELESSFGIGLAVSNWDSAFMFGGPDSLLEKDRDGRYWSHSLPPAPEGLFRTPVGLAALPEGILVTVIEGVPLHHEDGMFAMSDPTHRFFLFSELGTARELFPQDPKLNRIIGVLADGQVVGLVSSGNGATRIRSGVVWR